MNIYFIRLINSEYSWVGINVYGYDLKIGWGKSVSLPSQALPVPPPGQMAIRNKEVGQALLLAAMS